MATIKSYHSSFDLFIWPRDPDSIYRWAEFNFKSRAQPDFKFGEAGSRDHFFATPFLILSGIDSDILRISTPDLFESARVALGLPCTKMGVVLRGERISRFG